MNICMKKFMVLSAALTMGTSCLAMDPPEKTAIIVSNSTPKPTKREMDPNRNEILDVPQHPYTWDMSLDALHEQRVHIAETNQEDFENMQLVCIEWYRALTGPVGDLTLPYAKKYINRSFCYSQSTHECNIESDLPQLKVSRGLIFSNAYQMRNTPNMEVHPFICTFLNPGALTRLSFNLQCIHDEGVMALTKCTNLKTLNLTYCGLREGESISSLWEFPNLTNLQIRYNCFTKSALNNLSKLTNLETLNLQGNDVTGDNCLSPLSNLCRLRNLDLSRNDILGENLQPIADLSNITKLNLSKNTNLKTLSFLSGLTNLESLNVGDTPHTDFSSLATLKKLRKFRGETILSNDIHFLSSSLQKLIIKRIENINEAFDALPSHLVTFEIIACSLEDAAFLQDKDMEGLMKFTNLQKLKLGNSNQLTDDGLHHLSHLTHLRTLLLPSKTSFKMLARLKEDLKNTAIYR